MRRVEVWCILLNIMFFKICPYYYYIIPLYTIDVLQSIYSFCHWSTFELFPVWGSYILLHGLCEYTFAFLHTFNFSRYLQRFLQSNWSNLLFCYQYMKIPVRHHPCQYLLFPTLFTRFTHCKFNFYFPDDSWS